MGLSQLDLNGYLLRPLIRLNHSNGRNKKKKVMLHRYGVHNDIFIDKAMCKASTVGFIKNPAVRLLGIF